MIRNQCYDISIDCKRQASMLRNKHRSASKFKAVSNTYKASPLKILSYQIFNIILDQLARMLPYGYGEVASACAYPSKHADTHHGPATEICKKSAGTIAQTYAYLL